MIYFKPGLANWSRTKESIEQTGFTITYDSEFNDDDIILNWGGTSHIDGGVVFNLPENVSNASDKVKALELLEDLAPMTYSEYSTDIETPFVVKKNHTHAGYGKRRISKHKQSTPQLVAQYDTIQEFLEIEQEYRVLCIWNGKRFILPRIYEKVKIDDSSPRKIFHPNWDFQKRALEEIPEEIRKAAIQAVQSVKLHFVGVDIAQTNKGIKVIEVNSAPGLGINSANKIFKVLEGCNGSIKRW